MLSEFSRSLKAEGSRSDQPGGQPKDKRSELGMSCLPTKEGLLSRREPAGSWEDRC